MEETRQIQPTATENNNSDDLDLIGLIRICWRAFVKYICRPINFCIRFTLKHWWQTAIIIVVAFVLSVSYNMWINPKYEMSIKFANKYLSSQYFIDATNSLFQSDNREYLASRLGISADSIDYLKKLQALYSLYGDSNHSFSYKDKGKIMEYLSLRQTAEKWGLSIRRVQTLCSTDRIPGAVKIGSYWAIPADAEKPKDERIKSGKYIKQ